MADPGPAVLPPQDLDAEESVLGAMMLATSAIDAATEIVQARDFYRGSHSRIFDACLALYERNEPVDAITVADELAQHGKLEEVGGKDRIHEIATLVPATSNVAHYAKIVKEMATLRGLTVIGDQIGRLGWDRGAPAKELVERAEQLVFDLSLSRRRSDFVTIGETLAAAFARLEQLHSQGKDIIGVPTGFERLDALTSGFQPGNLIVVAARPSMGKSALALGMAANVAIRHELPVALFTLEMNRSEVTQRILSAEADVDGVKIRNGRLNKEEWGRLHSAAARVEHAPFLMDDSASITMTELRSKARRLLLRNPNLGMIVVDYLQLMTSGGNQESRQQEIALMSRNLKVLASELEVPVVAISQLSRAPEGRHDKRPVLSDLRESGAIEQDADLVLFLYRDEYYNPEDTDQQGIAEVNLAKHRNGPTNTVKLSFVKRYAKFSNLAAASAGE